MRIKVKLDPGATLPTRGYDTDAGWDLYAKEEFTVPAGGSAVHDTGVHMAIPRGYCGLIVSKSGLNVKKGLTCTGLVDSHYTGSIVAKIYNSDQGRHHLFRAGEKITQIVVLPIPEVELELVSELEEAEGGRGANGFGSTGK